MTLSSISVQNYWVWSNPNSTSNPLYTVNVLDTNNIWAFGESGTAIRSTDFGKNWEIIYLPEFTGSIKDSYFFDEYKGFIIGKNGVVLQTENACKNWMNVELNTYGNLLAIDFEKEKGVILSAESKGNIYFDIYTGTDPVIVKHHFDSDTFMN